MNKRGSIKKVRPSGLDEGVVLLKIKSVDGGTEAIALRMPFLEKIKVFAVVVDLLFLNGLIRRYNLLIEKGDVK